jgi:class 3 adenylate cyclase
MSTCEFSDGRCCVLEKILRGSVRAALVARHGLEKIKTIGDCYTAAAGVPNPHPDHARKAALLALDMRDMLATSAVAGQPGLELRIGHQHRARRSRGDRHETLLYDLWADAVNTASRMESHGTPREIQISRMTYGLLKDEFICRRRGTIPVKGKGPVETRYLVGSRSDDARAEPGVCSEALDRALRVRSCTRCGTWPGVPGDPHVVLASAMTTDQPSWQERKRERDSRRAE